MYSYQGTLYTHDINSLPLSIYDTSTAFQTNYNYITYSTNEYREKTLSNYNIDLKPNRALLGGFQWSKIDDGSEYIWYNKHPASEIVYSDDGSNISGAIRFDLPAPNNTTQKQYYKFSYYVPSNYKQITSRINKVTSPEISDKIFYKRETKLYIQE